MKSGVYISYSWAVEDATGFVNAFCELATQANKRSNGISAHRDKDEMRYGDNIQAFMDEIGASERILVVVSERYFRSEFCLFELLQMQERRKWPPGDRSLNADKKLGRKGIVPVVADANFLEDHRIRQEVQNFWIDKIKELEKAETGLKGSAKIPVAERLVYVRKIESHLQTWLEEFRKCNFIALTGDPVASAREALTQFYPNLESLLSDRFVFNRKSEVGSSFVDQIKREICKELLKAQGNASKGSGMEFGSELCTAFNDYMGGKVVITTEQQLADHLVTFDGFEKPLDVFGKIIKKALESSLENAPGFPTKNLIFELGLSIAKLVAMALVRAEWISIYEGEFEPQEMVLTIPVDSMVGCEIVSARFRQKMKLGFAIDGSKLSGQFGVLMDPGLLTYDEKERARQILVATYNRIFSVNVDKVSQEQIEDLQAQLEADEEYSSKHWYFPVLKNEFDLNRGKEIVEAVRNLGLTSLCFIFARGSDGQNQVLPCRERDLQAVFRILLELKPMPSAGALQ